MNDMQRMLKDMVSMFIVRDENLTEQDIDAKIDEVRGLPTFSSLSEQEINEVRADIKS